MAKISASDAAKAWVDGLSAATTKMQRGVNSLTVSPTESAAKAKTKMLQNLTTAVNSGKWEAGLRSVTLDQWRQRYVEKGLPRVATGAAASQDKMQNFMTQLLAYQDTALQSLQSMPNNNKADSKARMNAWFDKMAQFSKK